MRLTRHTFASVAIALWCVLVVACGSTAPPGQTTAAPGTAGSDDPAVAGATPGAESAADDGLAMTVPDGPDGAAGASAGETATTSTGAAAAPRSPGGGAADDGGSTTRDGTAPRDTGHPGSDTPAGPMPQGVTAKTIKVGVIGIDQGGAGSVGDTFGASVPNPGDSRRHTAAIVKYINSRGGVAGRKLEAVVVNRNPNDTDPNQGEKVCRAMTEDHKVYAVVTNYSMEAWACYAKHRTLLLNDGTESEAEVLEKFNPYVWSPGSPSYEAGFVALIDALEAQRYFEPDMKIGVLSWDDNRSRRIYNSVIVPRLRALGQKVSESVYFSTDGNAWASETQAAQLKFARSGITHVLFNAPGAGIPLVFMHQSEQQLYRPRYALSSYDSPGFLLQDSVPPQQLRNSVGAGWNMIADVDAQRGDPYPSGKAEKQCREALQSNGDPPPANRTVSFGAAFICDGLFMIAEAAKGLDDNLSVPSWAASAERLGMRFQATFSLPGGTKFEPGLRAGGRFYRWLKFVDGCKCFQYASRNKEIPR